MPTVLYQCLLVGVSVDAAMDGDMAFVLASFLEDGLQDFFRHEYKWVDADELDGGGEGVHEALAIENQFSHTSILFIANNEPIPYVLIEL